MTFTKPFLVHVEGPDDIHECDTMRDAVDLAMQLNAGMADTIVLGGEHAPHLWAVPWRTSAYIRQHPPTGEHGCPFCEEVRRMDATYGSTIGACMNHRTQPVEAGVEHVWEYGEINGMGGIWPIKPDVSPELWASTPRHRRRKRVAPGPWMPCIGEEPA